MPGILPPEAAQLCASQLADATFIDAEGILRYFSEYRIFSRPASCLGRDVMLCHSEESRPSIARMLAELRDGWRDEAIFLSRKSGRDVDVRYIAVRAANGAYLGCLELARWAESPSA